ncbi:MAG: NADH-quinone oxidoreductase subunit J [Pseudomonadota bacterium]
MEMVAVFFYIFSGLAVISALGVIFARNPVHAVLCLIVTFFNAAGLFILLGAEFLAMLLVIVYVGAVAVLFLFVVMMLDVDFAELRAGLIKNAPLGVGVGGFVLAALIYVFIWSGAQPAPPGIPAAKIPDPADGISNTQALGEILYTKYIFFFQGAGLVLLVAMIGAIVLTLRQKEGVKRQSIPEQVGRRPDLAVTMVKLEPGQSIVPSKEEGPS